MLMSLMEEKKTPYHIIWECNDYKDEMEQLITGILRKKHFKCTAQLYWTIADTVSF